jgi:nucleoside-specific outer membrane channel protein Tsx
LDAIGFVATPFFHLVNLTKDHCMKAYPLKRIALVTLLATGGTAVHAADWSDNSLSLRYGTKFAEPFNEQDISKRIVNFSHVSGYKYGTNFLGVDFLLSDQKDPSSAGASSGAHEAYAVYRHTLDLGKISGANLAFGPVRGLGLTAGFDFNAKTDAGYNSKKRMLVAGPTLMFDVPGFLNLSLLALRESNAPYNSFTNISTPRYTYKVAGFDFSFEGFANYIGNKGKDEFGFDTKPETNVDMQIMYDMSPVFGAPKNTFKLGLEYQYWRNKFGNDARTIPGATAKTPMVRAEYHF